MMTKVDRVSMLNSLEVRVPFLDHKLVELSQKIPSQLKLKNDIGKYILKKTMGKYLPTSIINRKKRGFSVPLEEWFKKDLKEYVNDKLFNKNGLLTNYFNIDYISKLVGDHNMGVRSFNHHIWSLLFFNEWLEQNK